MRRRHDGLHGAARLSAPRTSRPRRRLCNGLDNDCDGAVDNGNPGGGVACSTGLPGVCAAGTTACAGGAVVCTQTTQASTEVCDGLDNDCDGVVDDGNPGGGLTCSTGLPGVCAAGTTACTGGAVVCTQNTQPSPEACNGLDDDCDGAVDNGNPGGGVACSTGHPGVCAAGTTACTGGAVVCAQTTQPSTEACNGLDDDCDGAVDNGDPGGGLTCNTGHPGICAAGTTACSAGSVVCTQNSQPSPEACNGLDDDCDGAVDGFVTTCGVGECFRHGTCTAGIDNCTPGASAPEVCDNRDNDCDGLVDGFATTCGVGDCLRHGTCTAGTDDCLPGPPSAEVCDGQDNDCDGSVDNAPVPTGIPALFVVRQSGATRLQWTSVPGAATYDVVRGDAETLHISRGDFSLATGLCLGNDQVTTFMFDPAAPQSGGHSGTSYDHQIVADQELTIPGPRARSVCATRRSASRAIRAHSWIRIMVEQNRGLSERQRTSGLFPVIRMVSLDFGQSRRIEIGEFV